MGIVLLGNRVRKFFPRYGWHRGTIVESQPNDAYLVRFDDGCAQILVASRHPALACSYAAAPGVHAPASQGPHLLHREEYTCPVPELLRILDGAAHKVETPSSPLVPERKPDPQPDRAARKVAATLAVEPKSPVVASGLLSLPETPDEQPLAAAMAVARKRPRGEKGDEMSEYER